MRELLRSLARANMKRAGISHSNRKIKKGTKSYFAKNWRKYAIVPPRIHKACEREQAEQERRREIRNSRRGKGVPA